MATDTLATSDRQPRVLGPVAAVVTPAGDPTGTGRHGVRRRPSGEPPALRREAGWTRRIWLLGAVVLLGAGLHLLVRTTGLVETIDAEVSGWFAGLRTPGLTRAFEALAVLTTFAVITAVRWLAVIVLAVQRRFRHAVVFVATFVVIDWVVARLLSVELPRPQASALVATNGYSFPSKPVAALAITLFAAAFPSCPGDSAGSGFSPGSGCCLDL
jgi:hypothetical protein